MKPFTKGGDELLKLATGAVTTAQEAVSVKGLIQLRTAAKDVSLAVQVKTRVSVILVCLLFDFSVHRMVKQIFVRHGGQTHSELDGISCTFEIKHMGSEANPRSW